MRFRDDDVIDCTDQRLDPAVSDSRIEYVERVVPIRIQVPALICEDCGGAWTVFGDEAEYYRESFGRHREKYAPECGEKR